MKALSRDEIAEAMATIHDSRATHVAWRDKLKAGLEKPHEAIGDIAWHQACIDGYDQVLDVLRRVRP
jgi:hypothetical protein